jgi:hypothetical protein
MGEELVHVPDAVSTTEPVEETSPPSWLPSMIKRGIWWAIFAILITLAALWFLAVERNLVRYLITAALFALALEPAVDWFHERRGWGRGKRPGSYWSLSLSQCCCLRSGWPRSWREKPTRS